MVLIGEAKLAPYSIDHLRVTLPEVWRGAQRLRKGQKVYFYQDVDRPNELIISAKRR